MPSHPINEVIMIELHPLTLKDKSWCDEIFAMEDSRSADFNFGNIYMWDNKFKQHLTRFGDRIIIQLCYEDRPYFCFPVGSGSVKDAMDAMKEYSDSQHRRLRISGITEEYRTILEDLYPGQFEFREDEPLYDYIYDIEKMSTYSGKKLHGKKNHCNRFEADYQWDFVPITREWIPRCITMLDDWMDKNSERLLPSIQEEYVSILRAFNAYEELGVFGGVLLANDRVVGFSVAEIISSDTVDIHFEKAYTDINGAYPMVCREMARMIKQRYPEIKYINREDDMGLESLRKSKLSYRPVCLIKKYTARHIDD